MILTPIFKLSTMLTLDPTTLFYWNLSDNSKKRKYEGAIVTEWAESIPGGERTNSRGGSSLSKQSGRSVPPLTNNSTITATSLTSDSTRKSHFPPDPFKSVNNEGLLNIEEETVISDRNEMEGEEHEDAVQSPPKGSGVRVASDVSDHILRYYFLTRTTALG